MSITVPAPNANMRRALRDLRSLFERVTRAAHAPLKNLLAVPLTTLGVVAFDIGVFQWSARVGWMVTGITAVLLEHVIADED